MKDQWRLDDQICFMLYKASRLIARAYKPLLDPLHLTYTQYVTMIALWENDNQTVTDLGRRLDLDSGTLTPLLKKLEKEGLVERRRNPTDERKVIVSLTLAGMEMAKVALHVPSDISDELKITEHEIKSLRSILVKLRPRDDT